MIDASVEEYFQLLGESRQAHLALLACSAALRLDDEVAQKAIELVASSNGRSEPLVRQIKKLGCVRKQWDESWFIAEDVRPQLVRRLNEDVPETMRSELRDILAAYSEKRANSFSPDGQITSHRMRQARLEVAYQRILIPNQSERGATELTEVWRDADKSSSSEGQVVAQSVDYLAEELSHYLQRLPVEVIFLQGMAARSRRDIRDQERYFGAVWRQGRPGYIFSMAAHLFGLLVRDRKVAEDALRDSIDWEVYDQGRAMKWHSLGNFLSRQKRVEEAKNAYNSSLRLDHDPESQAETWHSLGKLLSVQPGQQRAAEDAYRRSLRLRHDPPHQGQVYHSLGNLLAKFPQRRDDAEDAYRSSLERLPHPKDKAQVLASWATFLSKSSGSDDLDRAKQLAQDSLELDPNDWKRRSMYHRILADVYERQQDYRRAVEALKANLEADRKQGERRFEANILDRIKALQQRYKL